MPVVVAKGPEGPPSLAAPVWDRLSPKWARKVRVRLCLVGKNPFCWGPHSGARDVRRAPYYYEVGYSGIYVGGQVQSQFPLLGLGSFYLPPPTQNKHQPLPLPVNFPLQIPEGA